MTIAAQKKQENIVEYILYLWQMQDLVRAADFEMSAIRAFLDASEGSGMHVEAELEWFASLMRSMKLAGVQKKGHIPETDELLVELNYLHHTLLDLIKDKAYLEAWLAAKPSIEEFLKRSENENMSPVEAAVTAMYGWLVLRLKKKEVSKETLGAMKLFQTMLSLLAGRFHKMRSGDLDFSLN